MESPAAAQANANGGSSGNPKAIGGSTKRSGTVTGLSPIINALVNPTTTTTGTTVGPVVHPSTSASGTTPTTPAPGKTSSKPTVAPTTVKPTTVAPTTVAPTTVAPTTVAPTTVAPTTVAPTTVPPTTVAPTTVPPTTVPPTTSADPIPTITITASLTVAPTSARPGLVLTAGKRREEAVMTRRSTAAHRKGLHADEIHEVNPNQVFYSPGGRRGWILLTILVLVGCFIAVAVDWARTVTTELPPQAARYNTSVNYPREVYNAVSKCAKTDGQYGDSGNLEMPVIGTGVFQRVVKVVHDGGTDYAVDPFTGQVYRPLTQLEAHGARCGYAVEEFGTVPAHTLILTYDDGPSGQWTPKILGVLDALRRARHVLQHRQPGSPVSAGIPVRAGARQRGRQPLVHPPRAVQR